MVFSKSSTLLMLLACGLSCGLVGYTSLTFDCDLGWHLLGGRYVALNHAVPSADFINAFNTEWHDYHWLAQWMMWKIFDAGGFNALTIAHAAIFSAIGVALALNCARFFGGSVIGFLVLIWSGSLIYEVGSFRPQLVALFIIAMSQWLLFSNTKRELVWLFLGTVFLANVHVYWIVLPALWALYRAFPRLLGDRNFSVLYSWGGLLLLSLAPLLSPYGLFQNPTSVLDYFKNYFVLMEYSALPFVLKDTISEFRGAFAVPTITPWILIGSTLLFGWGLRRRWSKQNIPAILSILVTLIACALAVKYVALFAILSLPFWAEVFPPQSDLVRHLNQSKIPLKLILVVIFLGSILLRFSGSYNWRADPILTIDSYAPFSICTKLASLQIKSQDPSRPVRILTHFNDGGWCKLAVTLANPDLDWRVTTDNRTQNTPGEHYQISFDLFGLHGDWLETLLRWQPDVAVVNKRFPLASYMALAPQRWEMVAQDNNYALFLPRK